jgi:TMEM70/TMEM186/TMEM223 protein family
LGEAKYKNVLAGTCFILGYLVLACGWTYTLRSVRYLILKKDGKTLSFITYTPFGKNRIMDVPLKYVSAEESRTTAKVYLPLKVQNRYFYYILDMSGEFKNTRIFDTVVALRRKLKN